MENNPDNFMVAYGFIFAIVFVMTVLVISILRERIKK